MTGDSGCIAGLFVHSNHRLCCERSPADWSMPSPISLWGELAAHPSIVARNFQLLNIWSNSFSLQGEAGKWSLSPAHSALIWGEELWQMPAVLLKPHDLPNDCLALCYPQEPSKCWTPSALRDRNGRSQILGNSKKVGELEVYKCFLHFDMDIVSVNLVCTSLSTSFWISYRWN